MSRRSIPNSPTLFHLHLTFRQLACLLPCLLSSRSLLRTDFVLVFPGLTPPSVAGLEENSEFQPSCVGFSRFSLFFLLRDPQPPLFSLIRYSFYITDPIHTTWSATADARTSDCLKIKTASSSRFFRAKLREEKERRKSSH
jgi:hypothetical protein